MKQAKIEKCKWALKKPYLVKKDDKRYEKFNKHLKQTGISPDETWSLYNVVSEFVLPRLKLFKEQKACYPHGMSSEEWDVILDKMIFAFEFVKMEDELLPEYEKLDDAGRKDYWKRYEEGIKLFSEWFMALWW
jgi:hypothetical protein